VSTLRIRDNGKVKELNIPKDKLEVLQKIVSSKTIMDQTKRYNQKTNRWFSLLCMRWYSCGWSGL